MDIAVGELGLKPKEFWELTYAEFLAMYRGQIHRQNQRVNEIKMTAWFTALYARQTKLPELDQILNAKPKKQTPEQMLAIAQSITSALGGEINV